MKTRRTHRRRSRPVHACSWLAAASLIGAGQATAQGADPAQPMSDETFAGLELRSIGPALMSGRVSDLAVHPTDQSHTEAQP